MNFYIFVVCSMWFKTLFIVVVVVYKFCCTKSRSSSFLQKLAPIPYFCWSTVYSFTKCRNKPGFSGLIKSPTMVLRGKGRSIPLPYGVWINRPKLPALHAWPLISWTEGNAGHSSSMTRGNRGRRKKPNDRPDPLVPKWFLFVRGYFFIFSLRIEVGE